MTRQAVPRYEQLSGNSCFQAIIEEGTDDQINVQGFKRSCWKTATFWVGVFITGGLLKLLTKWFPYWQVKLTCSECPLASAKTLLITDNHGHITASQVLIQEQFQNGISKESVMEGDDCQRLKHNHEVRFFIHKHLKYIWDEWQQAFLRLRGLDKEVPCSDFFEFQGYSAQQQQRRRELFGPNIINIEVHSYLKLLVEEVLNPFYIFQSASIILWSFDSYYYYASCILCISIISIIVALYETRKQQRTLHAMVASSNAVRVAVHRNAETVEEILSADLVPGDLVVMPQTGCVMACDAVLVAGNCIVDESMLTGESVPEVKTPLPKQQLQGEMYDPDAHKRHTLFCGTKVIQTRYYGNEEVLAVVVRTGFSTSKGELVRSILFARPASSRFYRDAMRFVLVLFGFSCIGMAYSIYAYLERHVDVRETIIRALDIVTIVVPPALPAAMTVGTIYAQNRLKKRNIFCISPPRITAAAKLKLICFDKTGTLTEEGLDVWGLLPVDTGRFSGLLRNICSLPVTSPIVAAMATCHSLTRIDGELTGDPLDLKMFLATEWEFEEPGADTTRYDMLAPTVVRPCRPHTDSFEADPLPEIGILRQFPFSSGLQRMSVVCRTLGSPRMDVYAKGAPEKIAALCLPETVPPNFPEVLRGYAVQGFRVVALAHRRLDRKTNWHHVQRIGREQVECDLCFLGLLVMQNALKPETEPVIRTLHNASIRTVMVTGDNVLTALSVARDCGMIGTSDAVLLAKGTPPGRDGGPALLSWELADVSAPQEDLQKTTYPSCEMVACIHVEKKMHFAIDGRSFAVVRTHFPNLLPQLLVRGTVFARMTPDQKAQLVEALQQIGYSVGMCGDGANDCGALKAADVGISLSEAEASVAAPFTSKVANIECVPVVISEGRCALVVSQSVLMFIAMYSLTQFFSVLLLYSQGTNLTDAGFLVIDLPIITTLAIIMGYTEAEEKLDARRPKGSMVNLPTLVSLVLQLAVVAFVQLAVLLYLKMQPWHRPLPPDAHGSVAPSWENSMVFLCSSYQYLILAFVSARGPPYQKPIYTNVPLVLSLVLLGALVTFLLFNPFLQVAHFFQLIAWQPNRHFVFRLTVLLMAASNLAVSVAIQMFMADNEWLKHISAWKKRRRGAKNMYKVVERQIHDSGSELAWISAAEKGPVL